MRNLHIVRIGYNLKLLGVDNESQAELITALACCEKVGLVQRVTVDGKMNYVRANPKPLNFVEKGWTTIERN